jgi:hypothetical protein
LDARLLLANTARPANRFVPLSRYDLTSQAGQKFSSPHSPPSTQAVYSNMVYLLRRGVYGFYKHFSAADKR